MSTNDILKRAKDGRLSVIVTPNTKKTAVLAWDEARQALRVSVEAPPERNRANVELVKFLSRLFGKRVELVAGATGRRKILRLN
jgi:hypothetical protein